MAVVELQDVAAVKGVLGAEQMMVAQARRDVAAGQHEHRGLAGRQEAGVRLPGDAAELAEPALH